jgi:hypothetical protein
VTLRAAVPASPSTTTTTTTTKAKRRTIDIPPLVIVILLVIAVIATGVGFVESTSGGTNYACLTISHHGNGLKITTDGLIHYVNAGYYITCPEGASLPSGTYKSSCLTVSPKTVPAQIGVGASTNYYYLSASGNTINITGAPAMTNGSEIITPTGITLTVTC